MDNPPIAQWRTYRRLWVYLRPYTAELMFVVVVSLLSTSLGLAQPYISKLLIDRALMQRDMNALIWIASLMFGAVVLGFALNILASYRYVKLSAAMLFDMRLALFRHLQTLSPRFYANFRLGDLMSRLNNDVGEVQRVSGDTVLSVLSNVVFLVGSVGMMLWLNWRLFLVSFLLVPASLVIFARYQRKLTLLTKRLRERSADLGSLFVDTILGMRVVVSLNAREREMGRFGERNQAFVDAMLGVQVASFMAGGLPGTILSAATAVVFLYGGWIIFHGSMTIGTLVAFMAYHSRLLSPVQNLMTLVSGLASARVSLGRIFELFDTPAEVREQPGARPFPPIQESIRFDRVSIGHGRDPVLVDVSLAIPAGSFAAVLGPSGAGKSTLAELLVRYLDPDSGRILMDDQDLRDVSIEQLRNEVVLVDQSPFLFNATLRENIAYGRPDASEAEILEVARQACLMEFIEQLPQGLETRTGERGLAISVGEKHRIAVARALLRRPSVLILDEPTAALDADTEARIARSLREAMKGRTVIVITHRPALAEIADLVIHIVNRSAAVVPHQHAFHPASY